MTISKSIMTHDVPRMSAVELLAILLQSRKSNGIETAQQILSRHKFSLRQLSNESIATTARNGSGTLAAIRIHAALELGRRMAAEQYEVGVPIKTADDVFRAFARLQDAPTEEFHVGILTSNHCLERDIKISDGILTRVLVHPREAFRTAIVENAAAVVFVHNHPSGDPRPSSEDIMMTSQLVEAGKILDIEVIDHVIIGRGKFLSMKEYGGL